MHMATVNETDERDKNKSVLQRRLFLYIRSMMYIGLFIADCVFVCTGNIAKHMELQWMRAMSMILIWQWANQYYDWVSISWVSLIGWVVDCWWCIEGSGSAGSWMKDISLTFLR